MTWRARVAAAGTRGHAGHGSPPPDLITYTHKKDIQDDISEQEESTSRRMAATFIRLIAWFSPHRMGKTLDVV
jgi:hypothetical protein